MPRSPGTLSSNSSRTSTHSSNSPNTRSRSRSNSPKTPGSYTIRTNFGKVRLVLNKSYNFPNLRDFNNLNIDDINNNNYRFDGTDGNNFHFSRVEINGHREHLHFLRKDLIKEKIIRPTSGGKPNNI
jgi:hypothetical protein